MIFAKRSLLLLGASCIPMAAASARAQTTAWNGSRFVVDAAGVVSRSDIVLGQPNMAANQAMMLGNGRLGVSVWAANGLTAQLNRVDTMPGRYSPGQVVIPGLAALTAASDYSGRLDLYNGAFFESGGGMTATAYVQPNTDALIIDVTGANPNTQQTVQLKLWSPRTPVAAASGASGTLASTFVDNGADPGASGRTFGALSAITAIGRDVSAVVTDPLTITVTVTPDTDGSFRVVAGAPSYSGTGDVTAPAQQSLADLSATAHVASWNAFWQRAGLIKLTSPDGTGEYMENLRNVYLYTSNAENGGIYPGSQAGVADMFSSVQDAHHWDSAAFWHRNLRMQVSANLSAGLPELNAPYFNLYRSNLVNIQNWTLRNMAGRPGICTPETMRFNGQGIEYEIGTTWKSTVIGLNCSAGSKPYYNARTLSTAAEVTHWVWNQYLATGDKAFLAQNYPLMAQSARFLLAYQTRGQDGLLHTSPSNAHETQWDTVDPTTDLAAMRATFPETISAEFILGQDLGLAGQLSQSLSSLPDYPRTQEKPPYTLLSASADAGGADVIADSYNPGQTFRNYENIGLEPVWPWDLVGDTSPLYAVEQRTFQYRPNTNKEDWSFDPIQGARLGFGADVSASLLALTSQYQTFVNGLANWGSPVGEFYVEQDGVVAAALAETLVEDYDGIIKIAHAIPPGWDYDGSVYVRNNTRVDVQVRAGVPTTLVIEPGASGFIQVRNPWPGRTLHVAAGPIALNVGGTTVTLPVAAGTPLVITPSGAASQPFAAISGTPATGVRRLTRRVQIGLPPRG